MVELLDKVEINIIAEQNEAKKWRTKNFSFSLKFQETVISLVGIFVWSYIMIQFGSELIQNLDNDGDDLI
jgi:hypothetical protein